MRLKFSDKLPIFLERCLPPLYTYNKAKSHRIPSNAPMNRKMAALFWSIRKKLKLDSGEAVYLHVNGRDLVLGDTLLSELYERKRSEDGFLHLIYSVMSDHMG